MTHCIGTLPVGLGLLRMLLVASILAGSQSCLASGSTTVAQEIVEAPQVVVADPTPATVVVNPGVDAAVPEPELPAVTINVDVATASEADTTIEVVDDDPAPTVIENDPVEGTELVVPEDQASVSSSGAPAPVVDTVHPSAKAVTKPVVWLESVSFSAIDAQDHPASTTGVVRVSWSGVPTTGNWAIVLTFDDFVSNLTGTAIPAASLRVVDADLPGEATISQDRSVFTLILNAAGKGHVANGKATLNLRLVVPNPDAEAFYQSAVTVVAAMVSE